MLHLRILGNRQINGMYTDVAVYDDISSHIFCLEYWNEKFSSKIVSGDRFPYLFES